MSSTIHLFVSRGPGTTARGYGPFHSPRSIIGFRAPRATRVITAYLSAETGPHSCSLHRAGHLLSDLPGAIEPQFCDLLHRAIRRPTPPELTPVCEWTLSVWFTLMVEAHRRHGAPLTWSQCANLFSGLNTDPTTHHHPSWNDIYGWITSGRVVCPTLTACEASWFDAGSMARWLLAQHRSAEEALEHLSTLASTEVLERAENVMWMFRSVHASATFGHPTVAPATN